MRGVAIGVLVTAASLAADAAWIWHYEPERLPQEWRRQNPNSRDYMPALYRWLHGVAGNKGPMHG